MHVYIYYVRIHIYHVYFRVCNIEKQQRTRRKKKKEKKRREKTFISHFMIDLRFLDLRFL